MTHQDSIAARGPTLAQLKAEIDAGRTGDKVANADPGLSPLGTDDEAAGNPPSPERISLAQQVERRQGAAAGPPVRDTNRPGSSIWIMVATIAVIAVAIIAVVLTR